MQLALDGLDRLVDVLQEQGALSSVDAARLLFATGPISDGLACSLLADVTAGDSRIVCTGATVSLAGSQQDPLLEEAEFVVFDLETTGLSAARNRICEIGAARVRGLELVDSFQSLVNPRVPVPQPITRLTGLREQELRRAPPVSSVIRRFIVFAGDAPLAAHNARFDQRFLERQLQWLHGRRLAEPPLCTAALARRLLEGRVRRVGLASLADFFGVPTRPCHRALPDAESTAQVLVHLIGLAQEVGARRVSDLRRLEAPRKRRVYGKRPLASRRAQPARRLSLSRQVRPGALRGPRPRSAGPPALLLPKRTPAPVGRGGPACARANRVACSRLRARSCARGAAADPRAATSGQLTQPAS